MKTTFVTIGYCIPTDQILQIRNDLIDAGYDVVYSKQAGTLVAKMDNTIMARASQMGHIGWSLRAVPGLFTTDKTKQG